MRVLDHVDAFKQLRVQKAERQFLGGSAVNGWFVYCCVLFGVKSGPLAWGRTAAAMMRLTGAMVVAGKGLQALVGEGSTRPSSRMDTGCDPTKVVPHGSARNYVNDCSGQKCEACQPTRRDTTSVRNCRTLQGSAAGGFGDVDIWYITSNDCIYTQIMGSSSLKRQPRRGATDQSTPYLAQSTLWSRFAASAAPLPISSKLFLVGHV